MVIKYIYSNITNFIDSEYSIVHCISSDLAMGYGAAGELNELLNLKDAILEKGYVKGTYPFVVYAKDVFNLITKQAFNNKPKYETMDSVLSTLSKACNKLDVKKIAMTRLGCGIDGLDWNKVLNLIIKNFQNYDIEILVCEYL